MSEDPETDYERAVAASGLECSYYGCWKPAGWVEPHPSQTGRDHRAPAGMTLVCDEHHEPGVGYPLEH